MNATLKALIANRDWDVIREMWEKFIPDAHGIQQPCIPPNLRPYLRSEAQKDGVEFPASAHGGARPGAGKPPTTPGAGLAAVLERAERSVAAIEQRGDLRYAEAAALFARAAALSERIERLMVATPDYPESD